MTGDRIVDASPLSRVSSVVLDDLGARRIARRLGLEPIGTVGLLLAGKRAGLVPLIRPELDQMRIAGIRTSQALYDTVILDAGE